MFDYVKCDYPFPATIRPIPENTMFQTKSFPAPCLSRYYISDTGLLQNENGMQLRRVTMNLEFYEYFSEEQRWIRFKAHIISGVVVSFVLLEDTYGQSSDPDQLDMFQELKVNRAYCESIGDTSQVP